MQDKSSHRWMLVIPFVFLVFISGCSEEGADYEIIDNSVVVDDSNIFLNVTPHTISGPSWVETEFESKVFSGAIDFAYGFPAGSAVPTKAEIYRSGTREEERHYTCGYEFNYTLDPNYFWCYKNVDNNGTMENQVVFEHSFTHGNIQEKTAYWQENVTGYWEEWDPDTVVDHEFMGMSKWYLSRDKDVTAGQRYKLRFFLDAQGSTGKYALAIKPHSETIQEAIENEHFYYLDPWWESKIENYNIDSFNRADGSDMGTADSGTAWVEPSPGCLISSNAALFSGRAADGYCSLGTNQAGEGLGNLGYNSITVDVRSNGAAIDGVINFYDVDNSTLITALRFAANGSVGYGAWGSWTAWTKYSNGVYKNYTVYFDPVNDTVRLYDGTKNTSFVASENAYDNVSKISFQDTHVGGTNANHNVNMMSGNVSGNAINITSSILPTTAYTDAANLNCTATVTIADSSNLNVSFTWFNGTAAVTDYDTSKNNIASGTATSGDFMLANVKKGETWTCQITGVDFDDSSISLKQNTTRTISNSPPLFTHGLLNWTGNYTLNKSIDYNCTDLDLDTITYKVMNRSTNITGNISINTTNGNLSISPSVRDFGLYQYNVTCADGTDTNLSIFNLTVETFTPSVPITFSPTNNPYHTNIKTQDLTCSGSTDPLGAAALNYTFFKFRQTPVNLTAYSNAGAGTFTEGSNYATPHTLTAPGGTASHEATATMQFKDNKWVIDANVTDTGGNLNYLHIYLDGTDSGENQIYAATAAKDRSNITLNISDTFLDGQNYTVTFKLDVGAGGDGQTAQFWWDQKVRKEVISNSTNTSITIERPFGNWSCEAWGYQGPGPEAPNRTIVFVNLTHGIGTSWNNYVNFTFKDEINNTALNATADFNFLYKLGGESFSYAYDSSTKENKSYAFRFMSEPVEVGRQLNGTPTISYGKTGYETRLYSKTTEFGRPVTNITLYLLSTAVGNYVSFHVLDTGGFFVSGVNVKVEKKISGTWTEITNGVTDDSGTVQFWLFPTSEHRLTFTKSGYSTQVLTLFPNQANYYVTLGVGGNTTYVPQDISLVWGITPQSGLLNPNSQHDFTFNISSNSSSILACRMVIIANNTQTHVLANVTGCNAVGGILNQTINVSQSSSIDGLYYVNTTNSSTALLISSAHWEILPQNATTGTFKDALTGMNNWTAFGSGTQASFSKMWFFFIMMAVIIGLITYSTAIEFNNPGSVIVLIVFMVGFASYAGMFQLADTSINLLNRNDWYEKWAIFLVSLFLGIGYYLNHVATRRGA